MRRTTAADCKKKAAVSSGKFTVEKNRTKAQRTSIASGRFQTERPTRVNRRRQPEEAKNITPSTFGLAWRKSDGDPVTLHLLYTGLICS